MGRQVNFYMTPKDEQEFIDELFNDDIAIVYNTFTNESELRVRSLEEANENSYGKNLSIARECDFEGLRYRYVNQQGYYSLNTTNSKVIQFSRCTIMENGRMKNGRFWFDPQDSNGKKSPDFIKWADSILKLIKKKYTKDEDGRYVAPEALRLQKEGKLELGPSKKGYTPEEAARYFATTKK